MTRITPIRFMGAAVIVLSTGCALVQEIFPGLSLSDSNVVSMLESLDNAEIDAARLAQDKAADPQVKAFAGRVLNEHRQLAESSERLASQLSLQPDHPGLSSQLANTHEDAMRKLRSLSGPSFDRAYLEHELKAHLWAFNFLETAAANEGTPQLKQELVRTGPDLLSHISAAKALQRRLDRELPETVATR